VLVALTALLTACASPIAGTPHAAPASAAPPGGGLPLEPEQVQLAQLSAQVRSWDICAMHDTEAAARATGYAPDELLPYREPGICRLLMKEPNGVQEWELQLEVAQVFPTQGGRPIEVAGVQMPQVRGSDDSHCAYSYPIGQAGQDDEQWGIELSASSIAGNKAPCDVARDYATAIAPLLAEPPLRRAGGTKPALDLSATDPCAVAAAMVPALGGDRSGPDGVEVSELEPYKCGITVEADSAAGVLRGSAEFRLASAADIGSVTIGGFPGSRDQLGINCQAQFAPFNTLLAGNPEISPSIPVVDVVGDCDHIDALATAAAGAIAPPSFGAPRQDALALGDLNPPPTAQSVGSPFDPCTVVGGWQAYPADLQPDSPRPAVPLAVDNDVPFKVGCKFNTGEMLSSLVWGEPTPDGFSADPKARSAGAVAKQYAGKPGVEEVSTNTAGQPTCYSAVQISQGIAAMVTVLPSDPCRVNRVVLEQVAQKVP
jgi:hypothetical protein